MIGSDVYTQAGQWQRLHVANASRDLIVQQAVLRNAMGRDVDLRQPYVDAIVVNAYTGPGTESIRLDDLRIENALPTQSQAMPSRNRLATEDVPLKPAFPIGVVKRFIEYNGESLQWLRSIGFTGIVLSRTPDANLLREANQVGMELIVPQATVLRQDLANLLSPVVAWNLGDPMLEKDLPESIDIAGRLRRLPASMRRQLIAFPVEAVSQFRSVTDALAIDLPPPVRGLSPDEESAWLAETIQGTGHSQQIIVCVAGGPSQSLRDQVDQFAKAAETTSIEDYGWHATWLQTMRALEISPRGIVFRSSRALDSGRAEDGQRANVLRLINRYIELTQAIVSSGSIAQEIHCHDAAYRARYINNGNLGLIIASSNASVGTLPNAGNGKVLKMEIPAPLRGRQIFRFSGMYLERLPIQPSVSGSVVDIVAPDFVELLLVSNDPSATVRFDRLLHQQAGQVGFDRWQLIRESLLRTTQDWDSLLQFGLASQSHPAYAQLRMANEALRESGRVHQSGDIASAYRLLRRADAWDVQATSQLVDTLAFDEGKLISHPALIAPNSAAVHIGMMPRFDRGQWKPDDSISDPFANPKLWDRSGWAHDRRREDLAHLSLNIVDGPTSGRTMLSLTSSSISGQPLPGGYAGTMLRARSPQIRCQLGECFQIDARIRVACKDTPRPHRGGLIYDSFAGSELGLFVRPDGAWRDVRLYRAATTDQPLQVIFELIGEGELQVADFAVSRWRPRADAIPFRPLGPSQAAAPIIAEPLR
ncbi:MAG: hypothetical protein R3C05_03645 [Pirellulaceae bacterium]